MSTLAVLELSVPEVLYPVPDTIAPCEGLTSTVIRVLRGRFWHCMTMFTGVFCNPKSTASGRAA